MNAQVQSTDVEVMDTEVLMEVADGATMQAKVEQLETLSNEKLEEYYNQKAKLNAEIEKMTLSNTSFVYLNYSKSQRF